LENSKEEKEKMWEFFNIVGITAFVISGTFVAMEEEYDLMGVYVLGLITAFGGGAIRNSLLGLSTKLLWDQQTWFFLSIIIMTLVFYFTKNVLYYWKKWGDFLDAIGLSAFSIQGAIIAKENNLPISAIIAAALLTGIGGGIVRDVLAKRQPLVLKFELYALWSIIAGIFIGFGLVKSELTYYVLFIVIVVLRMASLRYKWSLPKKKKMSI
jgi:uncharacterized membrane protein YeiH